MCGQMFIVQAWKANIVTRVWPNILSKDHWRVWKADQIKWTESGMISASSLLTGEERKQEW